ncbi:MAG: hypothetical protein MHM6MM_006220 [Cercozoa sp. M6MM]
MHRGTVRFVGAIASAADSAKMQGEFVGVQLDEPFGKNDGTAQGRRYFECAANYGIFVRPAALEIGDFPVEDAFASDSDLSDSDEEL